jgi:DNA (cytosine-5)-methyltransferase 1
MEKFKAWLVRHHRFSNRAASDVASRLRRANAILKVDTDNVLADYLYKLSQKQESRSLSISVRSQLRRAVTLYWEFNRS